MKNLIKINILTYIFIFILLAAGYFKFLCIIALIISIHEIGHIIFCLYFKRKITDIYILPTGGLLKIDSYLSTPILEDLLIAFAGIIFQIILGYLTLLFDLPIYSDFYYYNRLIIIFNLLPIYPLDGFKITRLIFQIFLPYKKSLKLTNVISIFFIIFLIYKVFYFNILVLLFIIIMQYKEISMHKYIINRFYLERMNNTFIFKKRAYINKVQDMYKNKINILNGKKENEFIKQYFYNH